VADSRQNSADLAVSALVQHDFQFSRFTLAAFDAHGSDAGDPLRKMHARAQPVQFWQRRTARDAGEISLVDAVPRVGQPVGQRAVVGDQNQPLAGPVQSADGKQPLVATDQVDHAHSRGGIPIGRNDARRLVHGKVQSFRRSQRRPVHADLLPQRIDSRTKFGDGPAIDLDAPGQDQLLALAPAADTGGGQHLLQTLAARHFFLRVTVNTWGWRRWGPSLHESVPILRESSSLEAQLFPKSRASLAAMLGSANRR